MEDTTKIGSRRKSAKSFLRGLAAATCLTATTTGVAHATTTNEGAGDAFGNTFAARTPLSVGTNVVNGSIFTNFDIDFFEFSGLLAGGAFDISFSSPSGPLRGSAFTDLNAELGTPLDVNFSSTIQHITGNTPSDGKIVIQVQQTEDTSGPYTVGLSAPLAAAVPEPATGLLTGLGAAVLALRNLKRRKLDK